MAQSLSQGRQTAADELMQEIPHIAPSPHRRWGFWLVPVLLVGLAVLAGVGLITAYEFRYAGQIYPGVRVDGIATGGMTPAEAEAAIKAELIPYPGDPVLLRYGDRTWSLAPDTLGVVVDAHASAAEAFEVGRVGGEAPRGRGPVAYLAVQWKGLRSDLMVQWLALREGYTVEPQVLLDEGKITYTLMRIARDIDLAPREGLLTVAGLDVIAVPGASGRQVDVDATRRALLEAARAGQGGEVDLVVLERYPMISTVDKAAAQAKALLSQPLALLAHGSADTYRFAVDRATLRQWLQISTMPAEQGTVSLATQLDRDQVVKHLQQLAAQVNRPVQDAALDFNPGTGQLSVVKPSQTGQQLDLEASVNAIEAALSLDAPAEASQPREIVLPVAVVQPKVDSGKVAEMGIVELVSEGSTSFAGSSKDRVHNIVTAANKFQNVVVPPGEEFSFNRWVGEITSANGFTDSLIIAGDRTAVGVGGGVCQVSTTVFRAALNGGFPITQRYAHGYVVSWYGKPGLDATIFTPDVDFRFLNDSGHYLLVKPSVDTKKGQITFSLYGTRPAREVEIGEPEITNVRDPEKPLYQEDQSLPAGVIKQVDWAAKGLDAVVVRTVRNADGTVREDKFVSKYQPWQAIFLYGPGTKLPAGAVTSTP